MTDNEYLEKMITITNELDQIANHELFKQEIWDENMDEMHRVTCDWHNSRCRRPRFFKYVCWFLLGVLASVILHISC